MDYVLSKPLDYYQLECEAIRLKIDPMEFAARMRFARNKADKTQRQVAEACGVTFQTVCAWETGQAQDVLSNNLYAVADFLGVNARWLSTGQGEPYSKDIDLQRLTNQLETLPEDQRDVVKRLIDSLTR